MKVSRTESFFARFFFRLPSIHNSSSFETNWKMKIICYNFQITINLRREQKILKRHTSRKHNNDEKLLFSGEIKPDEMYIDEEGNMKFLVTGADVSKFGVSLTIKDPITGKDLVINSNMNMPTSEAYMKQLDNAERLRAKEDLEKANLLLETDTSILGKLSRVIEYKEDVWSTVTQSYVHTRIESESIFFRVRKIWDEKTKIERVQDLSYVPDEKRHIIKYGRLNDRKEQIMYLADTYLTAMEESRLKIGDNFYLSLFVNEDNLILRDIRQQLKFEGRYGEVEKKISEFLFSEFTKVVPEGEEYKYRISNLISKHYFSYNVDDLDGWIYPSIVSNGAWNLALSKESTDKKLRFLVSFQGIKTSESTFSLSNPLIKSSVGDELLELNAIINNGRTNDYSSKDMDLIQKFCLSLNKA